MSPDALAMPGPGSFPGEKGPAAVPSDGGGSAGLSVHERVLAVLRSQAAPLFAILDAARDPLILARLLDCKERHESLYEGPEATRLAAVAPYLVALPSGSAFLAGLVREGWGQSWGVYLTSERPFEEVRRHLRRFLTVELEGGRRVLFRFYDPRVLRVFLPTCTREELGQFFGPISSYRVEGADANTLLRFSSGPGGLLQASEPLAGPGQLAAPPGCPAAG